MSRAAIAAALFLTAIPACALLQGDPEEEPFRAADLQSFADRTREAIEENDWQTLISESDPEHYATQVVELGMEEPQYVAELLGLHMVDNNIQEGDTLEWRDLDRIESATLEPMDAQPGDEPDRARLTGTAVLESGETLQLNLIVRRFRDRYVLTGAVG